MSVRMLTTAVLLAASAATADADVEQLKKFVFSSGDETAQRAEVKKLLEKKPGLASAKDDDGTLLESVLGNLSLPDPAGGRARFLADQLVAKGADVNAKTRFGDPLLIKHARFAQVPQIEYLVAKGADVNAVDEDQRTALHWVALLNESDGGKARPKSQTDAYVKSLEVLLAGRAKIDARDKNGATPLWRAAFLGNIRMSQLLIDRGADVNAADGQGCTVLGGVLGRQKERWANAQEKSALPPVVELLKKKGAKDTCPE